MTMLSYIYNKVLGFGIAVMLLAAAFSFSACGGGGEAPVKETKVADSLLLKVAVFPSLDALPLALANDWGVLDSLGANIELSVFRSQMDAEKALAEGRADAVLTDMLRVGWWQWQRKPLRFAFATRRPLFIVPNRVLRVSKVEQLDDRMIAATRNSLEDFFVRRVVASIKKRKGQILYPQINSVELRLSMLKAGQLDAAVLNRQQALKAQSAGYAALSLPQDSVNGLAGVAFNVNALRTKGQQLSKLRRAYDIVVERLRKSNELPQISDETRRALFLTAELDTLVNPRADFAPTTAPDGALRSVVAEWLRLNAAAAGYTGDTLFIEH